MSKELRNHQCRIATWDCYECLAAGGITVFCQCVGAQGRSLLLILYLVMMVVSPVLSRRCGASSADAAGGLAELMTQELAGMDGLFRRNLLLDYETMAKS